MKIEELQFLLQYSDKNFDFMVKFGDIQHGVNMVLFWYGFNLLNLLCVMFICVALPIFDVLLSVSFVVV